ncbi:MAG: RNA methyltransferase [Lachnospiraceae bacterium]|nr:RNA methyltransferase [Lachnospiraceae bacterium]
MITSTSNQQVKNLIQLQKKAKVRNEQDVFLVEGMKMYEEAPRERLVQTFMSESFYRRYTEKGSRKLRDDQVTVLSDSVFAAVSDTRTPQGVLCLIRQYHYRPDDLTKADCPLLIVLENLQDPGNLGTIVRTAEGAGVTGILLTNESVDIYNPKVIRSTMGSVYRMPFYYTDSLSEMVSHLKKQGIRFYAAHLQGAVPYDRPSYSEPSAFMIGNESRGLSDAAAGAADACVKIPMCGNVESLNAGIASAILMYEAARQRRKE